MVFYLCVLIVFSLCGESLKLILVDEPPLRGGSVIVSIRASMRQHTEVPKNHNYACR
jgi:hypothetical protein